MMVKIALSSKRTGKRNLFDHILPQSSKDKKMWSSRSGGVSTLRVGSTQAQSGEPGGVSTIRVAHRRSQVNLNRGIGI